MFEHLTTIERIELAKAKMAKVLDHFLYVIELHANNSFVVYSSALVSQIPESYAAQRIQRVSAEHAPDRNRSAMCCLG